MRTMAVVTLLALVATVAVAQPVTITGRVVGPDGEAVAGAQVATRMQTQRALEWVEAVSDANGRFTLQFDPERERPLYQIIAVAEGLSYGAARVEPGAEVEITLADLGEPITGTVADDEGAPISGAVVAAPHWNVGDSGIYVGDWRVPSAVSDEQGRFSLSGLPAGARASLSVKAEGFAGYRISTTEDRVATVAEVAIALHPEAVIAGRVMREGQPVADVRVSAQAQQGAGWGDARTDAEGRYVIRGLPADTYNVGLEAPEGLTAAAHEGVNVEAGQRVEARDFALIEGSLVHGAVTWADTGEPVEDALIAAYGPARPKSGAWVQNAQTDAEGQYELRLPPGENYVYWMGGPDDAWQSQPESETFALGDEPHRVDFALTRTPTTVLTVRLPDGAPAVSMPVLWGGVDSYPLSRPEPVLTDERGQVELVFRRRILWEGQSAFAAAVVSDEESDLAGCALIDAAVQREATMWLEQGAYVSGSVDTLDGEPVPQVSVRVTAEPEGWDTQLPISAATDERGEFRLGPLPPGLPLMIGPDWGYREQVIEPDVQAFRNTITL
jgi:protocatechuate 3,4-dioxygenase beta subunit